MKHTVGIGILTASPATLSEPTSEVFKASFLSVRGSCPQEPQLLIMNEPLNLNKCVLLCAQKLIASILKSMSDNKMRLVPLMVTKIVCS